MPKAVIKSVETSGWGEVVVAYEVLKDDGALWEKLWLAISLEEYSVPEVERRLRMVLTRLKQIEVCRCDPNTPTQSQMQSELVDKEIVL